METPTLASASRLGQESSEERMLNIPYTFVPRKKLEYTLSAGIVENRTNDRFSRADIHYGVSNKLTVGGGMEFVSETSSGEVMPFVNASASITPALLFTGEYMYGVKSEGLLSYRTSSNLQVDFNYINYNKNQTAINYNYLEERKISFSLPIHSSNFSAYSRFSVDQIILPLNSSFTTAQFLLSGAIFGISTNLTTYGLFHEKINQPTVYATLSQNYRLPFNLLFSPQLQYDFSNGELTNIKLGLERSAFSNGFMNIAFENNFLRNSYNFEIGLRYNFDFAQTSFTSRIGNLNSLFVQSARGSLRLDDRNNFLNAGNQSSVGKGSSYYYSFSGPKFEWQKR